MLINKNTRRQYYRLIERALRQRKLVFETFYYDRIVNTQPLRVETYLYQDDVAYYQVTSSDGGMLYCVPIVWLFDEEAQSFRQGRINTVVEMNPHSAFHLVFCDPSWSEESIKAFRNALILPLGKTVAVSRLEDWMSKHWQKVQQARTMAVQRLLWTDAQAQDLVAAAVITEVDLGGEPHSVRLSIGGQRGDVELDIIASFHTSWLEDKDIMMIATEIQNAILTAKAEGRLTAAFS